MFGIWTIITLTIQCATCNGAHVNPIVFTIFLKEKDMGALQLLNTKEKSTINAEGKINYGGVYVIAVEKL